MTTAIILSGGGFQGLVAIRSLQAIGWRVLVLDSLKYSPNRFEADIFIQTVESKYFSEFTEELFFTIKKYKPNAIFPTAMHDLPVLASLRNEINDLGSCAVVSVDKVVRLLSDKRVYLNEAIESNFPVLPLIDIEKHDFVFPLIGKPASGWGGNGLVRVKTREELGCHVSSEYCSEYIWQRDLDYFVEWSTDFAIDKNGDISPIVCRVRNRTTGGFSVVSEFGCNDVVERIAEEAAVWLSRMGGFGVFNVQYLEDRNGGLWLNDINPRPGTSSTSTLAAGTNLFQFLVEGSTSLPARGLAVRTLKDSFIPALDKSVRGVIFDLDETLICQKSWMKQKLNGLCDYVRAEFGVEKSALFYRAGLQIIDEGPWDRLIELAIVRSGLPSCCIESAIENWRRILPQSIVFHPDALSILRLLNDRNIPVGLVSDNPASSQRQKISLFPGDIEFQSIVLTEELGAPKPDSSGFLQSASDLRLPASQLLMVGDNPWRDALGAVRSGYAGAVIISRRGSMFNFSRTLFDESNPHDISNIFWLDSLRSIEQLIFPDKYDDRVRTPN